MTGARVHHRRGSSVVITSPTSAATRRRALSLSLVAQGEQTYLDLSPAPILCIPAEITLEILEHAISASRDSAFALARTCKHISHFVDTLLYRTVVLPTTLALVRLHRTLLERGPAFAAAYVRRIIVASSLPQWQGLMKAPLPDILNMCTGVRNIEITDAYAHVLPSVRAFRLANTSPNMSAPCEVTLSTYADLHAECGVLPGISRVRILAPSQYTWVPPHASLAPALPGLTHIALPRRAGANEDNDEEFIKDVHAFLAAPDMQMVVVVVWPPRYGNGAQDEVTGSEMWKRAEEVRKGDSRVVVIEGRDDEDDSTRRSPVLNTCGDGFWERMRMQMRGA